MGLQPHILFQGIPQKSLDSHQSLASMASAFDRRCIRDYLAPFVSLFILRHVAVFTSLLILNSNQFDFPLYSDSNRESFLTFATPYEGQLYHFAYTTSISRFFAESKFQYVNCSQMLQKQPRLACYK